MLVLIDNYDSFAFNLVHYLGELGAEVDGAPQRQGDERRRHRRRSRRHRAVARPVHAKGGRHLPRSDRAGRQTRFRSLASVSATRRSAMRLAARSCARQRRFTASCLKSAITAKAFSAASTRRSRRPAIIRWWSSAKACQRELHVTADTDDGLVMGLAHTRLPVHGVQFHPESIASEHGHLMLKNFLDIAAAWNMATGRRERGGEFRANGAPRTGTKNSTGAGQLRGMP